MKRTLTLCMTGGLLAVSATPAFAWDEFGHVVVAAVAWDGMTPQARARAIQLLQSAPPGSGLGRGFSSGSLSPAEQLRLFGSASHWPDDIRSPRHPGHGLHRGNRHFVNLFWEQRFDFGPVRTATRPPFGDLLNDMPALRRDLTGSSRGDAAIALAWIIHLVGDIHQPLHSSSRITPLDPNGDRGGNDFGLRGSPDNLHSFWDGLITRNHRQRSGESAQAYLQRVAGGISSRNPRSRFTAELAATNPDDWARESLVLAQRSVYRNPLRRERLPSRAYELRALAAAEPRIALAGYRLADLLNQAIGR
ncbi:MAG TPA: S1/P1 nuclease [Longimicrobium sp.]|nr:S1/P1 nuclease [Longimicrobium sp.]